MHNSGFSVLELLIALLVGAVLLTAAVPAMDRIVAESRRTADVNTLVASVQLARSESAKRGRTVRLCGTVDGTSCADSGSGWDTGWLVFVDDPSHPPDVEPADALLMSYRPVMSGTIRSNRASYVFRPNFRRGTNGTITFCDHRGASQATAVIISYTGRPRVSDSRSGGQDLVCPG